MRCAIVDDEKYALQVLNGYISQTSGLEVVAQCRDGFEIIGVLNKTPIDLLFLDIQMPQLSGFDVIKALKKRAFNIILTTAHEQYAVDAFEFAVFDYLLKPFSYQRFLKPIERLTAGKNTVKELAGLDHEYFFVKENRTSTKIHITDIHYIKASGNYLKIYLPDRYVMVYMSLIEIQNRLPSSKFIQIHKSYIISIKSIKSMKFNCVVVGNTELPVGRSYRCQLDDVWRWRI